ncbi:hypothetical protein LCGC14_2316580 [marine sediment metagenome]|uniref:Uncharacterized protein n=1 Tax=marine sediment metagenome TaxID=412755 RepID=A0A0F9CJP3_9ZZZZ|nr:hypothetical protein [Candidatus Aminicenantes bacterium]
MIDIEIKPPNLKLINVEIFGTSPLICHRWSEKAKKEMLDKQMKKSKVGRQAKNPEQEFKDSLYPLSDGSGYGFPAVAFKLAAVRAAQNLNMHMTQARQLFFVYADDGDLVRIQADEPTMREDMVRLNGKVPDIRYRGEFKEWKVSLKIRYNADIISAEQVCNLLNLAGFSVGIGDWRTERNGIFGSFSLIEQEQVKAA